MVQKTGATRLAARIQKKLGVTPKMEEGQPGELSVYVGSEKLEPPSFLGKALGLGVDNYVETIGKKLAAAKG